MKLSKLGMIAVLSTVTSTVTLATANTALAFCGPARADVSFLCPRPVPYPGPKYLTPTSRNMPTVGTPGLYRNWGNGYDVQVYSSRNAAGRQDFLWAVPTDYGKNNY